MDTETSRAEFWNPPLIEMSVGFEFQPLLWWNVPHFGLFWNEIRADYPRFEVREAVTSTNMILLDPARPPVRCWFMDPATTGLIQVQNDRLIYNWRRVTPEANYPKYDKIRPVFEDIWARFGHFLNSQGQQQPSVEICDITYVNHINRDAGDGKILSISDAFLRSQTESQSSLLAGVEPTSFATTYEMVPESQAQLMVQVQPAVSHIEGKAIFQFTLNARLRPASTAITDIFVALDRGHDWNVQAFKELTAPQMQQIWRRKSG